MQKLTPFYEKVQTHYDLSDDFFELFLDPTRTYSCAYFERDDMSLEEAQIAKVDLALRKCDLRPGMTLLDIGCGWGSTMMRAAERYDVHVIGLTLSRNQYEHVSGLLSAMSSGGRTAEVRLQGWEEFDEPVDRIVSIGAFEHFRRQRYDTFFERASRILPADGRMLLHTIVGHSRAQLEAMKVTVTREDALFLRFIMREIFPGGQLPDRDLVITGAQPKQFLGAEHRVLAAPLRPHTRSVGAGPRGTSRRRGPDGLRGGLPAIHPVSDRLRRELPTASHRRPAVHAREAATPMMRTCTRSSRAGARHRWDRGRNESGEAARQSAAHVDGGSAGSSPGASHS